MNNEIQELKNILSDVVERLEKIENLAEEEEEKLPFKSGEAYFCVSSCGQVIKNDWIDSITDLKRLKIGNAFKTKEEVEYELERWKVYQELKRFSRPFEADRNNYYIFYEYGNSTIDIHTSICLCAELYFESREKAQQAIESVGEERVMKFYLGVD